MSAYEVKDSKSTFTAKSLKTLLKLAFSQQNTDDTRRGSNRTDISKNGRFIDIMHDKQKALHTPQVQT